MAEKKLMARRVETEKRPGLYSDGGGLFLQVTKGADGAARKSWVFRFTSPETKRPREMGLGPFEQITLAEARAARDGARALVRGGVDPIEERKHKSRAAIASARAEIAHRVTFDEVAARYIAAHKDSWRNAKHRQQWANTLKTYASPIIGKLPVAEIDATLVLAVLEQVDESDKSDKRDLWSKKPETASRLRGRIETILNYAKVHKLRQGENPAAWEGNLKEALPARSKVRAVLHHPAMDYAEVPAFMARLRTMDSFSAYALRFTILTAARTGEVLGAQWSEIDLEKRFWTIPAERMKAKRAHRIPLTGEAVEILQRMTEGRVSDFIFPGARTGRPLSNMALTMLLRGMGIAATVHGFRSSFSDWRGEETEHSREVAEAALAHIIGDKAESAYRRGDSLAKRVALMADWAAFLAA